MDNQNSTPLTFILSPFAIPKYILIPLAVLLVLNIILVPILDAISDYYVNLAACGE